MSNSVGVRMQPCWTLCKSENFNMERQTGFLPLCSRGTLQERKVAFQRSPTGFGQVYENYMQRTRFLNAFLLKLDISENYISSTFRGEKAVLILRENYVSNLTDFGQEKASKNFPGNAQK